LSRKENECKPLPRGALPEQLMGAVAVAYLETAAAAKSKKDAFCWGGGEKFAVLLNDTCVKRAGAYTRSLLSSTTALFMG
jgi:hypothetical protein